MFLCGVIALGEMQCFVLLTGHPTGDVHPYGPPSEKDTALPFDKKFEETDREKSLGKYRRAQIVMPAVCCCVMLFYLFS